MENIARKGEICELVAKRLFGRPEKSLSGASAVRAGGGREVAGSGDGGGASRSCVCLPASRSFIRMAVHVKCIKIC